MRLAVLAIVGLLELAATVVSLIDYDVQIGKIGIVTAHGSVLVTEVLPDSPAERAGIVPGDELVYATLPLSAKRVLLMADELPAGTVLDFDIVHKGQRRHVTLETTPFSRAFSQAETIAYALSGFALGVVSLALVALRPSRMTWAFALLAPPMLVPWSLYFWALSSHGAAAVFSDIVVALLYAVQATGMLVFASRFPNDRPHGFTKVVDAVALPAGLLLFAVFTYGYLSVRYSPTPPLYLTAINDWSVLLASLVGIACFISTYATAANSARSRLVPAIASFVFMLATAVLYQVGSEISTNVPFTLTYQFLYAVAPAVVAAAVAYGVIRHRVIDVNFIISRTLVYTILTVFVVAVFSVIDYVFSKLLEEQRLAQVMELGAAIAIGISMNYMHAWLDRFLDVAFFRKRHQAEVRLEAAAKSLPHASTLEAIGELIVAEPADALDLASAAVFRREGDRYVRQRAVGWDDGCAADLHRDDNLVIRMRSELEPLRIGTMRWPRTDVPGGDAAPALAIPISFGHDLEAIAIYGAHRGGEDLDPDEQRILHRLAPNAALAYDRIAEREMEETIARLQTENSALRQLEDKLTAMIQSKLKANG